MLPLAILALTYLAIASRRWQILPLGRPTFALLGAVAMVVCGVLTPDQAFDAVDVRTLALLLGMMLLGAELERDRMVHWAEQAVLGSCRTAGDALVRVALISAVLAALLVNDTVCVLLTPVVVRWAVARSLPLEPFLVAIATSANLGSAATLVGNPQNMLIGTMGDLDYAVFFVRSGPVVAVCMLAHVVLLRVLYRGSLPAIPARPEPPVGRPRFGATGMMLAVAGASALGADLAVSALAGAALLLLGRRVDPAETLAKVDWALLLFFAGLFVVVEGGLHSPHVQAGLAAVTAWGHPSTATEHLAFTGAVVAGSNAVSNVPFVLLAGPSLAEGDTAAWVELAFVATVAGNLTLVGSIANLIVAEAARPHHELGFWSYLRAGLPATALSLLVGVPLLVWLA